jgi:dCMP deaminase
MKYVLAYVPVLQSGYLTFFAHHRDADAFFMLGSDLLAKFDWLRKDLRALDPEDAAVGLRVLLHEQKVDVPVKVLRLKDVQELFHPKKDRLIMPDEDIMHALGDEIWSNFTLEYEDVFLRWHSQNTIKQNDVMSDKKIDSDAFTLKFLDVAKSAATRSADWWRQVGAVLVRGNAIVLTAFNHHVPDQYQTLYQGDPRGNFKKGQHIDLTTAIHAEAAVIAEAARRGEKLEGCELYVTTFPCPNCAKLIAYSGIKKIYFEEGYSMVDGESILKENGVEIIRLSQS